jgi:hypothetical protein
MKIVLKNSQMIDIQGNTDAMIYDTTKNTLSVDCPILGQFVITFDTDTQVPDIRTTPTHTHVPALDMPSALGIIETITSLDVTTAPATAPATAPTTEKKAKPRQAPKSRNAHNMRTMIDTQGAEILVHKNDFVEALQLGYLPLHKRVILHNLTKWENRQAGQNLAEQGLYFVDVIPNAKTTQKAIDKIIDLIQNQACLLGYPTGYHLANESK